MIQHPFLKQIYWKEKQDILTLKEYNIYNFSSHIK